MQALATWSLASRWFKLAVLYGVAGATYWFVLIHWGKSPGEMLRLMPPIAGAAFALLLISWLITMRKKSDVSDSSDRSDAIATHNS
jgi:hypothetical protein